MSESVFGLAALNAQVRRDLDILASPSPTWVKPRTHPSGAHVYDVVIVGAGQSGLAAAFALMRERIDNILLVDECPEAREGPWVTYARMVTLRSPKHITGIDGGVPALTFRAWWEAQHGHASWAKIDKIPRQDWMDYLVWFRGITGLPVRNETRVTGMAREGDLFRLSLDGAGAPGAALLARKVILATGIQGGGEWHVPPFLRALPRALYAHTSEPIDFSALKGKRVGILGGGASAFDNAQFALRAGVGEAHVFVRRERLPQINPIRHMEASGIAKHYALLPDAEKYAAIDYFLRANQPPTNDTFSRAAAYPGFRLHLGAGWNAAAADPAGGARVDTAKGSFTFDFLIVSTGTVTDLSLRQELGALAGDILLWGDVTEGAAAEAAARAPNPLIAAHPYLGPGFDARGKDEAANARVRGIFIFNYAALASLGLSAAALSGMKHALPRLANGVAAQLFMDDRAQIMADYFNYDEPEFIENWTPPEA